MNFKVELTLEELNLCLDGLGELTAKKTYHLINKLHLIYADQSKPQLVKEDSEKIVEQKD
jgi:DNA-binding transcriptional regulator YhcF (GntR family)